MECLDKLKQLNGNWSDLNHVEDENAVNEIVELLEELYDMCEDKGSGNAAIACFHITPELSLLTLPVFTLVPAVEEKQRICNEQFSDEVKALAARPDFDARGSNAYICKAGKVTISENTLWKHIHTIAERIAGNAHCWTENDEGEKEFLLNLGTGFWAALWTKLG
ncbi:Uncharacterized protein Fot_24652 [Forsythia ovata]|uniref:Uncharacterized protein n=1 Tax=Forsythia ovata TaxID=205694 RepID=A0ABD1U6T4_9LAMI